jgi:hypothetical protein
MATLRRTSRCIRAPMWGCSTSPVLVETPTRRLGGNVAVTDPGDGHRGRRANGRAGHGSVAERDRDRDRERVAELGGGDRHRVDEVTAVILLSRAVRVYFAIEPTNLRLSFDGLTNAIRHALGYDPLSGHLFVFVNRRKNQVKLIAWTRGGFTIVHKRLERGTFTFPAR